jgi:hypothetical protein
LANQIDLPDTPITFQDGRPQPWFTILLRRLSTTVDGILQFIENDDGTFSLNADDIEQGLTQRVEQIANKVFTYNGDDTVARVVELDPADNATVIGQKDFTYNAQQQVTVVDEVNTAGTIQKTYSYNPADLITDINVTGSF